RSCLRYHLRSPILLSTPILNPGEYLGSRRGAIRRRLRTGPEEPHTPPAPQDEDEHEPIDYLLVVSPNAESPEYVAESDLEEDPEEYEDDETEDGSVDYPIYGGDDGDDDEGNSSGDDADD
nr:hypothetical protein [Tanacetum cinerariifolium]